jgi:outer membrane protein assembly factor BamB
VAWTVDLPGKGASSPIVARDRIYLTSQTEDHGLHVLALEAKSGRLVWDRGLTKGNAKAHSLHNMATPTAIASGGHIWVVFGTGDVGCLDRDGKVLWHRALGTEYGPYRANHGYGSSPLLLGDRLFVARMHQGASFLLALDSKTGKTLWKTDRDLGAREEANDSYSSPLPLRESGHASVVLSGAEAVTSYDPATGAERWRFGGIKVDHPYGRTIAGATAADGVVVTVASGFQNRGYTLAIRGGGTGDVTATHRLWSVNKFAPDCPTPVIDQGRVFTIRDDGMASCLDLKTGESLWQERLFTDNVKVSPVAAERRIYFTSGQGNCVVVKSAPKLEILARNEWKEETLSTPALSEGRIYLRTGNHLSCIEH